MPYAPDLSGAALDGRYELHAVIGEGAFGRVYRGYDRRLDRTVAVKLIKPWWAEDPDWARSFEREAQLLARVSHPGIVQIFDVGHAEEGLYFVSELVEGESLAQRLERRGPSPWEAARIGEQLCRALGRAHARGVVHRDVKPANILISAEGRVKVGDFGVARLAEGSSDGVGTAVVGTPRYMAPEQARGLPVSPATDVYSAGVVLYEMLAGQPPFPDGPAVELALRHLHDRPGSLPPTVPVPLAAIAGRALAKAPEQRYADGNEMADALAAARHPGKPKRDGRPAAARPQTKRRGPRAATRVAPQLGPRRTLNPSARRRSIAALSGVCVLLAAMIGAAVVLGGAGRVRVPNLVRLTRAQVRARTHALALEPSFTRLYDAAVRSGRVIWQRPRAGQWLAQGSIVRVGLSQGPPPVPVPDVAGESASQAEASLKSDGLNARVVTTIAPRVPAGTVYSQSPAPRTELIPGRRVTLNVAAAPQWRAVTWLGGSGQTTSSTFNIRGNRWRLVYTMNYIGTCTFIFICSGPNAHLTRASGAGASGFSLNDGGRQTQVFNTGPGTYRLSISPGSDTARWSVYVEDYY